MRILISGSTGFIGSTFVRTALQQGHTLIGLLRPGSLPLPLSVEASELSWVYGTLQEPPWRDIENLKPDCCVHAAWITTPGVYLDSPENHDYVRWSQDFLCKLGEMGVGKMLVLGTCIEYRPGPAPLKEDETPVVPTTTYARCKTDLCSALREASIEKGWSLCWGRVFYPYGPGEHPARLCSAIISRLMANQKVVLKTPASTKDYIYIEDLAEAMLTVLEKPTKYAVNLGTGRGVSVREIAQTAALLLNKRGLIEEAESTDVDPLGFVVADASRLRELGWKPKHDMNAGLKRMIAEAVRIGTN